MNNNNKVNNSLYVRPVSALGEEKMIKIEDIFEAYFTCRINKRSTINALQFEVNYESKLLQLEEDIKNRTYALSKSICFIVEVPKFREVFAADFRDRIIHHYIYNKLNPYFEKIFNERVYNCRVGKGTLKGIVQLEDDIRECSENYTIDCYIAKLDIKGFFMSIDKILLNSMVMNFIEKYYNSYDKEDLKWLCEKVILHNPTTYCVKKTPAWKWCKLDKNKSLFTNKKNVGIPIGNLSSQLFANFYLNELDWFLERNFKYHGRYVDDFYIINRDKEKILSSIKGIREILSNLHIMLNDDKFYFQHYSKGVKFIGAVIKPGRKYLSSRSVYNAKITFKKLNEIDNVKDLMPSVNSYLGMMQHYSCYNIKKELIDGLNHNVYEQAYFGTHINKMILR